MKEDGGADRCRMGSKPSRLLYCVAVRRSGNAQLALAKRPQGDKLSGVVLYVPAQNISTKVDLYLRPNMSDSYTLIGKLLVNYITLAGKPQFFPPYI